MKPVVFICSLFLLFSFQLMGQLKAKEGRNYPKLKFITNNGAHWIIKNAVMKRDSLHFYFPKQRKQMAVSIEKTPVVYYKSGNHGNKGLLLGFSTMAGYTLGAIEFSPKSIFRDSYTNKIDTGKVVLYMASSTVLDGILGSLFPKWKPMTLTRNKGSLSVYPAFGKYQDQSYAGTSIRLSL